MCMYASVCVGGWGVHMCVCVFCGGVYVYVKQNISRIFGESLLQLHNCDKHGNSNNAATGGLSQNKVTWTCSPKKQKQTTNEKTLNFNLKEQNHKEEDFHPLESHLKEVCHYDNSNGPF